MSRRKREIIETDSRDSADGRKSCVIDPRRLRRYPIGAELIGANETHFRIWAPKATRVDIVLEASAEKTAPRTFHPLEREDGGYFSGSIEAHGDDCYRFRVDNAEHFHPDPVSRFQPDGPHGSSCIVDPRKFNWSDAKWPGKQLKGQIIYEMHVGTFTEEGTWRAAAEQLPELARIGITVIEMMPIADFPGNFGWGYDGVDLFAPTRLYGTPEDLRSFVNHAHSLGIGVILDVVYNHFGPDGNYVRVFSDHYFTAQYENDWGESINFDGLNSDPVREFFITNGRYWIEEFHFDGFRFDATQEVKLVRPRSEGGNDLDGLLNDDFHHSAFVALTGRNEAYYTGYLGLPQEFVSAAKYGYLYQGQPYSWQESQRGTPTFGIPPEAFVAFIENHDQISNNPRGERLRFQTSPGRYRAMTALLLLGPWTPMLFQGQEFGASSPFVFFTDVGDSDMREAIRKGRFQFLAQFPSLANEEIQRNLPSPSDPRVFTSCKLNFSERTTNSELYDLYIDLIKLRREDSRFRDQVPGQVDGAVLGPASFVLRFFAGENDERLLIVNFGRRQ